MKKSTFKAGLPRVLSRGFTLYELLISLAIISIILGIVLYNQSKFNTDIEITNVAYRLALSIREAQVSGISVRQFTDSLGAQKFNTPYGIHFSTTENAFIFFADAPDPATGISDHVYTSHGPGTPPSDMYCQTGAGSECMEKVTIGRGNMIQGFCGVYWNGADANQPCSYVYVPGSSVNVGALDIKFMRPNPDALFSPYMYSVGFHGIPFSEFYDANSINPSACESGTKICDGWAICLKSPQDKKKRVVVYNTGQISVENVGETGPCSQS